MKAENLWIYTYSLLSLALLGLACTSSAAIAQIPASLTTAQPKQALPASAMAGLQMPFVENAGQTDASVGFYAQTFAGTTYVTRAGELVYSLPVKDGKPGWTLVERFEQGKLHPVGKDANISQVSYIKNQNGKAVTQNAATYGKLDLGEVFSGVRVELVAHGDSVEKVYTVAPGAHADAIRMSLAGSNGLSKDKEGALLAQTGNGPVRFSAPIAWQEQNGTKIPVNVSYAIGKNGYGFELGDYDHSRSVMIDPLLQATYLGGTGAEIAQAIQVHPITGDVYVLGLSQSPGSGFTNTFPGTQGGWETQQTSTYTRFLVRLTADLKTLVQSTYLESFQGSISGFNIHPINGDVYVWGDWSAQDALIPGIIGGAVSVTGPGAQGRYFSMGKFISRFSSDLTQLKQSTRIGIQYFSGGQFFAISPLSGDLYTSGFEDLNRNIIVSRIPADLKTAITRTQFGSSGIAFNTHDVSYGIAVHPNTGDVYVSGKATFNDFPATAGGYQPNNNSLPATGMRSDGFIAQLSPDLATIKQATYLGGTSDDSVDTITFDSTGNSLFLSGTTSSIEFPGLAGGAFSQSFFGSKKFLAKMSSDLKNLLQSTLVYSVAGTGGSLAVNPTNNEVYVIGNITIDGKTGSPAVIRFNSDLKTYYGGLALIDKNLEHPGAAYTLSPLTGDIYVTGNQVSETIAFPQTTGGYQATPATTTGGNKDIFIARFTSDDIASYVPAADLQLTNTSSPNPVQAGAQLTYTLTVKNHGPDTADQVKITDVLPSSVNFVSAASGCSKSGQTISCDAGTLAKNEEALFSIVVIPTETGGFSNSATVTGKQTDPNSANNTATPVTTVTSVTNKTADLSISQKSSAKTINLEEKLTYTLFVVNKGPNAVTGVQVVETLNGATLDSAPSTCGVSSGNVVCSINALAKGAKTSIALTLIPQAQGLYSNAASVTGVARDG